MKQNNRRTHWLSDWTTQTKEEKKQCTTTFTPSLICLKLHYNNASLHTMLTFMSCTSRLFKYLIYQQDLFFQENTSTNHLQYSHGSLFQNAWLKLTMTGNLPQIAGPCISNLCRQTKDCLKSSLHLRSYEVYGQSQPVAQWFPTN